MPPHPAPRAAPRQPEAEAAPSLRAALSRPPGAELLAALCMLEAALEPHEELSDQLLLLVFLRLPLWARAVRQQQDEASLVAQQARP